MQSFQSRPELHPPTVTIDQAAGSGVAPGYLFATPALGPGQYGPMIFDSSGKLIWFRPLPGGEDAADLQTQVFHSKNDLTWWQGRTLALGYGLGEDVIANANYKTVAVVKAGNGLQADEHEFLLTPEGSAFITAYSPVQASLASAGGPSSATVLDGVVQEIDVHTGLVMWEWHSLGHVDADESYTPLPEDPASPYDYFHVDSLALGSHGDLLISARNTWALYDVSRSSGAVLWRLGGKRSTFKLGAGVSFAYQHDATFLIDGEVSLLDDEAAPAVAPPSRGEFIKLDTAQQDRDARRAARADQRAVDDERSGRRAGAAQRRLDGRLGRAAQLHRIRRGRVRSTSTGSCRTARAATASIARRGARSRAKRRRSACARAAARRPSTRAGTARRRSTPGSC